MHLPDRRSRERFGIEPRINIGDVPPKFAPNYALNVSIRKRCDLVEKLEQLVAVTRGKKGRVAGGNLTRRPPQIRT